MLLLELCGLLCNFQEVMLFGHKLGFSEAWMDLIASYLRDGSLPNTGAKAHKLKTRITCFYLINNKLYRKSYHGPYQGPNDSFRNPTP